MNTQLLQIEMTARAYRAILPPLFRKALLLPEDYVERMPAYLLARCPLCGGEYTARLDTYSLYHWDHAVNGKWVFDERFQTIGCKHFALTQHFINLNGIYPTEERHFSNGIEVPYVIPLILQKETQAGHGNEAAEASESFVVMHSIPICRIENNQFVPRYDVYIMTYFAMEPTVVRNKVIQLLQYAWLSDLPIGQYPKLKWWDLPYWVLADKLWWLNPTDIRLALCHGTLYEFPYRVITGLREPKVYRS